MRKTLKEVAIGLFVGALLLSSSVSFAEGFVKTSDPTIAVRDSSGQCVRTGFWTPAMIDAQCNPDKPVTVESKKVVTVSGDVLFKFDSSELTDRGMLELDKIVDVLQNGTVVNVVGHADRIGNTQYNQRLSQKRAETVVDYLHARVGTVVYHARGVGSSEPLPETKQCDTVKNFNKLVACLQPNRRVEIEYVTVK